MNRILKHNSFSVLKVIVANDLIEPRGVAVAPELGWLFWSDWYDKRPKIERSNLDGNERIILLKEDLGWPNGITLDIKSRTLYFCDAKTDRIEVSSFILFVIV